MKRVGYYNGEIEPLETLKIPALDRAVYFGDGCYEASTFTHNKIFALADHLERFYRSLKLLEIPFDMAPDVLAIELQKCVDANELDSGLVYWQCSRGTYFRMHAFPPDDVKPNLLIYTEPYEITPPATTYKLVSMEDERYFYCDIKTLNLVPNVIAAQHCKRMGCDEVVFHRDGRVTEGAHSSILMLKDQTLIAPPRDNYSLPGITLKHLLQIAQELEIPVKEQAFDLKQLLDADEIIVSSSGSFCIGATEIDGHQVGGKDPETLSRLQNAYEEFYRRESQR